MSPEERFEIAQFMRDEWNDFPEFAQYGLAFLGFDITWEQADIAKYMAEGPLARMVQAQRSEAKSTLACLYAVWRLIQDPQEIILIISGGEDQAIENCTLITRLIMSWEILEYMRPDRSEGDRSSTVNFDIHWMLKGINKSPSVACKGVTGSLQGRRASLLIPDDVELGRNSATATQRGNLVRLTKEFSSICTSGDIMYLGTPQTKDSIYNDLEARGFEIRIWPGRYPTEEQEEKYGDRLAPSIKKAVEDNPELRTGHGLDGKSGAPTDPMRLSEQALIDKELDQGPEVFALQFMLDTSLLDAQRQVLNLEDLVIANFGTEMLPEKLALQKAPAFQVPLEPTFPAPRARLYYPQVPPDARFFEPINITMAIDPSGGKGDELAYAIGASQGSYIHLFEIGAFDEGLNQDTGRKIIMDALEYGVTKILVESNMGHGLFEENLKGLLAEHKVEHIGIESEYATGQKETRIINNLVGAMKRHKFIVQPQVIATDEKLCRKYSAEKRKNFSLFHQMDNITSDRGSLEHDDRLDAVSSLVAIFRKALEVDDRIAAEKRHKEDMQAFMADPMGLGPVEHMKPKKGIRALMARRSA